MLQLVVLINGSWPIIIFLILILLRFFGYGPGLGFDFTGEYNRSIPVKYLLYGKQVQLHSLYLNIFIEYGMLAFIIFLNFVKCF